MDTLGSYQIAGEIGRGGCGIVYSAVDPRIGRKVAIKTIVDANGNAALGDSLRERFRREARAAGGLSHPNIVTIHEFADSGEILYIVMEFVEGRSLAERLSGGPLPRAFTIGILSSAADALDYAHSHNIVHRDVKPANFLITEDGRLKIADFGIAKVANEEATITGTGAVIGTAHYMSPEQVFAKPVTGRSDQFSLAVVAFEMLTGRKPFQGNSFASILHQIASTDVTAINEYRGKLGPAVCDVLTKALSKDPAQRYASCREFADHLARALSESPSSVADPVTATLRYAVPVAPAVQPRRRVGRIVSIAAAAVVLIGAAMFYLSRRPQPPAPSVAQVTTETPRPRPETAAPQAPPEAAQPSAVKSRPRSPDPVAPTPSGRPQAQATPPPTPIQQPEPVPVAAVPPPVVQNPAPAPPAPAQEQPAPPKPVPTPVQPAAPARPSEAEAWNRVSGSSDVSALQQFRQNYPNGNYSAQAEQRIEQLEWDRARRAGDAKSIRDFAAKYPSSPLAANARAELAKLDQAAQAADAKTAITAALNRYRQAFENKDTEALKAAWPGLARAELSSFQSFFGIARSITLELQPLADPVLSPGGATLRCRRVVRASDNRGPLPVQDQVVNIHFVKSGDGMAIQSIDVSGR